MVQLAGESLCATPAENKGMRIQKASTGMHNAAVSGRGETKPGEKDGGCTASA